MRVHLETGRLVLRRLTPDDLDSLVLLDSDPEVMRYLNGGVATPLAEIRDSALPRIPAYYDRGPEFGYWAVEAFAEFLGWAFFRPHRGDGPPVGPDWPDPVPGDEHGEVQHALTAAEWAAGI